MKPVAIIKSFLGNGWVALTITVSILGFKDMGKYERQLVQNRGFTYRRIGKEEKSIPSKNLP